MLLRILSASSSTTFVELNHKTGKTVIKELRCRLKKFSQAIYAYNYNGNKLKKIIPKTREEGFEKFMDLFCHHASDKA